MFFCDDKEPISKNIDLETVWKDKRVLDLFIKQHCRRFDKDNEQCSHSQSHSRSSPLPRGRMGHGILSSQGSSGRGSCWAGHQPSQTNQWWCSCAPTSSFLGIPHCVSPSMGKNIYNKFKCSILKCWPQCGLQAKIGHTLQPLLLSTICPSASSLFLHYLFKKSYSINQRFTLPGLSISATQAPAWALQRIVESALVTASLPLRRKHLQASLSSCLSQPSGHLYVSWATAPATNTARRNILILNMMWFIERSIRF